MQKFNDEILTSIKKLTLLDDIFMNKVFEDDIEQTQFLLRIILNDDKIKVIKTSTQKSIKNLQGRDLQLDILAEKANGTKFNVEVQNRNNGAIPQRARYHMGVLDTKSLPKGKYFHKLPDNYVIFITKNDILKSNLPIYHIERFVAENGQSFPDGSHIIYVNSKIQDETPLGRLMHDFCCKNPDDMYYKELARKARYFKENKEGKEIMSEVLEELFARREREALARAAKKTEKAIKATRVDFAKELLAENESIERTARLTKLSLQEVRALADKMSA